LMILSVRQAASSYIASHPLRFIDMFRLEQTGFAKKLTM
jgi:hypothetical protein